MLIFRQTRPNSNVMILFRSSPRSSQTYLRNVSGNSNSEDQNPKTKNPVATKKILDKVSKTLTDVQSKGVKIAKVSYDKLSGSISAFDDLLGISELRSVQSKVRETESRFMTLRKNVQEAERELDLARTQLNDVRKRLDRVSRDDERYLSLATEEHKILLEEKKLKAFYEDVENQERDQFALLSGIVRESHEKERERAERTKHWSVVGSVVGAAIGVISSSVINYLRLKEVKNSIKETTEEILGKSDDLMSVLNSQDSKLTANSSALRDALETQSQEVSTKLVNIRDALDTYALSASIGSDVGTIEAGISLKTLTAQLRELVQIQLASEREKMEQSSRPSDLPRLIQEQMKEFKDENRNMFAELTLDIQKLNQKIRLDRENDLERHHLLEAPKEVYTPEELDIVEYHKHLHKAKLWSKIQIIASVVSIATSVLVVLNEISK